jgi:membrane associated rhomboid family serine protease
MYAVIVSDARELNRGFVALELGGGALAYFAGIVGVVIAAATGSDAGERREREGEEEAVGHGRGPSQPTCPRARPTPRTRIVRGNRDAVKVRGAELRRSARGVVGRMGRLAAAKFRWNARRIRATYGPMALGGFRCPYCSYYNALDEAHCGRCERRLPPAWLAPSIAAIGRTEYPATKALAAFIAFVFSCQIAASRGAVGFLTGMPLSTTLRFGALMNGTAESEPYRLLASCFVHFGALHIAFNLMALADVGRSAETSVGVFRFASSFFVTGLLGMVASVWWFGSAPYVTAGASGAVFGIQGLVLGERIAKNDRTWWNAFARTVFYSFVWYFAFHTNQAAHLGGLVVGMALGFGFAKESRPWRHDALVQALVALFVVGTLVSIALAVRSERWREIWRLEQLEAAHLR